MEKYSLDFDEGIILQTSTVERYGISEDDFSNEELQELILTNKNIIYILDTSVGLFSKCKIEIRKIPLNTIKIINGSIMVKEINHDNYGRCLQIQFVHGVEYWTLEKKAIPKWIEALSHLLLGMPTTESEQKSNSPRSAQLSAKMANVRFCSICGKELSNDTKFCEECGTPINNDFASSFSQMANSNLSEPKDQTTILQNSRSQEYVGVVLKCPCCGGVVTESTAICPDCGTPITKKEAVSSVQIFNNQLMAIEKNRKKKTGGMFAVYKAVDPADSQKLTLIRNFPIPNSIDDITEFMMLAIANIDVSLSKRTLANTLYSPTAANGETAATIERTISNAWVSKMEQCYRKAEVAFPNHPMFTTIQRAYQEKMTELEGKSVGSTLFNMFKY